jgi:hypothetical protein
MMEAVVLSSRSDALLKASALALLLACGSCSDNLSRREHIAYSAGNSLAANRVIQTIDPYPRRSFVRGQSTDGVKAGLGARRYLAPDQTLTAPATLAPATAGAGASSAPTP